MPKIAISTSSFDIEGNAALRELQARAGVEVVLNPHGRRMTEAEIGALLNRDTVGLIAGLEPLTRGVLEAAKDLRVISRCGVGLDNVDQDAAREYNVDVYTTPDAPSDAVAELTMGLMLAALRGICMVDRALREGQWTRHRGRLLAGQTVGILGLGRIGRRVAELSQAFGARVLACDPVAAPPPGVDTVAYDALLESCDVLCVHLPLTKETRHLIDAGALARLKPGALLINTSRGAVVDEQALVDALESHHLGGAGLDVFEHEPYAGPLTHFDHVVLSAHLGSSTHETRARMEQEAGENLLAGLRRRGIAA